MSSFLSVVSRNGSSRSTSIAGSISRIVTSWLSLYMLLLTRNYMLFLQLLSGKLNARTVGNDSDPHTISLKVLNIIGPFKKLSTRLIWIWNKFFSHFMMRWYRVWKYQKLLMWKDKKKCLNSFCSFFLCGYTNLYLILIRWSFFPFQIGSRKVLLLRPSLS